MPNVLSIFKREAEFQKDGFYIFDRHKKIMMCKHCNVRVEWERKDTCKKHVRESLTHKKNKLHAENAGTSKRQLSLQDSMDNAKKSKLDKKQFIFDTAKAFMKSNTPLEKLDNPDMRDYLKKYIPGAGDLPTADAIRREYVKKIGVERCENLKAELEGRPVVVLCDETTDRNGRCVFVILLRVLSCSERQKIFVGGIRILERADGTECARAIVDVLQKLGIDFNNVIAICTDSARYMTSCVNNSLRILFSKDMVHIQCWAHKLNLVAGLWSITLPELNSCVSNTKSAFNNTRKRKHHYISFLKEKYSNGEKNAVLFPSPVITRWNSWFKSVIYVAEYIDDLVEFLKEVDDVSASLQYFKDLTHHEICVIRCAATFLLEHFQKTSDTILLLEGSSYPLSHKLQCTLSDLKRSFELVGTGLLGGKTEEALGRVQNALKKSAIRQQLTSVGVKCATKLSRLIAEDPAKPFLDNLGAMFDPRNVVNNNVNIGLCAQARKIPFVKDLSQTKLVNGYTAFQDKIKTMLSADCDDEPNVVSVLLGMRSDHKDFVRRSVSAIWLPPSNVDSERAFSSYGNILTDLRTNLKPENLEIMLGLSFDSQ